MSLARRAKRRDVNEPQIIDALERCGAEVFVIDRPADLMVWHGGKWYVAEVKQPKGKYTHLQQFEREQGLCQGIQTWRTPLEALEAVGAVKREGAVISAAKAN